MEIWFDGFVLFVEEGEIRDEIADNVHVWQGIDFGFGIGVGVDASETGKGVCAADVHPCCCQFTQDKRHTRRSRRYLLCRNDGRLTWSLVRSDVRRETEDSTLILIRASKTIGPQAFKSTEYFCMVGFSAGVSGF